MSKRRRNDHWRTHFHLPILQLNPVANDESNGREHLAGKRVGVMHGVELAELPPEAVPCRGVYLNTSASNHMEFTASGDDPDSSVSDSEDKSVY